MGSREGAGASQHGSEEVAFLPTKPHVPLSTRAQPVGATSPLRTRGWACVTVCVQVGVTCGYVFTCTY